MVLIGILLLGLGVLTILAGVLLNTGSVEVIGLTVSAPTIFLIGVAAGASVLWGFGILKFGTKREWRQRQERKELNDLSRRLQSAEAERSKDAEDS
ncbi:MAG: hypothetical protein WAW88_12570 [Nocardioides sp.]